jgi:hypothetical protein
VVGRVAGSFFVPISGTVTPTPPAPPAPPAADVTIAGTITESGLPLSDIPVVFTGASTGTTNASGSYFVVVPNGYSGTATPTFTPGTFTPEFRVYVNQTSDALNEDYTYALNLAPSNLLADNLTVPESPTHLTKVQNSNGGNTGTIQWNDNSTDEDGFYVQNRPYFTNGTWSMFGTVAADTTSLYVGTLDQNYDFQIVAFNSFGTSFPSNILKVETQAPDVPLNLTGTLAAGPSVDLNWDDVATETGYFIFRQLNGAGFSFLNTVGANVVTYNDATVVSGTYDYEVAAGNTGGLSVFSNVATVVV